MNSLFSLNEFTARCCHWRQRSNTVIQYSITGSHFIVVYMFSIYLRYLIYLKRMNEIPLPSSHVKKRIIYYVIEEKYYQ